MQLYRYHRYLTFLLKVLRVEGITVLELGEFGGNAGFLEEWELLTSLLLIIISSIISFSLNLIIFWAIVVREWLSCN